MRYIYLCYLVLVAFILSCNGSVKTSDKGKAGRREVPVITAADLVNIDEPADGKKYNSGEEIVLKMSLKGDKAPDSLRVFLDGEMLTSLEKNVLDYEVSTQSARLGRIPLKIMAYDGDRRPQTLTHFVTVVSDIEPELYSYRLVNMYPHDITAYTQGLVYHEAYFYESTGGEGTSTLRKVEVETGEIVKRHNLESKFFGEGLAIFNRQLFQLTWRNKVGFVYDIHTFDEIRRVHYTTQGWGLTSNGEKLIMSDGTNKLYFLEPEYFTVLSSVEVYDDRSHVWQLNELEYINGEVWANIYMTDRIARIDPLTGKVLAYIDLTGILPARDRHPELAELNGIAWDSEGDRLFVTGKNWPRLFEIKLVRRR